MSRLFCTFVVEIETTLSPTHHGQAHTMTLTVTILTSPEQTIEEITTAFCEFIHNYTDYGCSFKPCLIGVEFVVTNLQTWGDCKLLLSTFETILNNRHVRGIIQHVNF